LLRWLGATAARELGRPDESVKLLEPLAGSDHPLAPWAKLTLAQLLEGTDAQRALGYADELAAATSELATWPGRTEAERLRARLYGKLGREDDAIRELTRLMGDARDEQQPLGLILPLADLLAT